jgi:hexokinase
MCTESSIEFVDADNTHRQTSLSEATLLPMGKGFAITSNMKLGAMLLSGYSPHCTTSDTDPSNPLPKIRIAAITNDTVATFLSLAYAVKAAPNSRVAMGLIVGTGTNATVPMRPTNLHPEKQSQLQDSLGNGSVVINTEWTIRGTDAPLEALHIKTKWDRELDKNSDAPGFQPFEYMTSGRYLGEIARLVFLDTLGETTILTSVPSTLQQKNSLPTWFLSEVVARSDKESLPFHLQERYPSESTDHFWTPARAESLRNIARAVQQRSSALIAAACVGLLDCVGDISLSEDNKPGKADADELLIAYTGGTISQYLCWLDDCQRWLDVIISASGTNQGKRLVLKEALDGGIIGAGVLAGMGSQ